MPTQPKASPETSLLKELLQGVISSTLAQAAADMSRALPRYVDDAERDFGVDLYERMQRDPALQSAMFAIKAAVLSEGPRFLSPIAQPPPFSKDAEAQTLYERGDELRFWTDAVFDNLQQPFEEILDEMLDYVAFGHSIAEQTFRLDAGQLKLAKLATKPRRNYVFAVDGFMNILGVADVNQPFLCQSPGVPGQVQGINIGQLSPDQIVPRSKLLVLSFKPKSGDPRGSSLLRAAYNAWWLKQQTWPQLLKYTATFGTPSIVGTLPPGAGDVSIYSDDVVDEESAGDVLTPEQAMLNKLLAFANSTAIVLPNGATFEAIEAKGDGAALIKAIELYNREMVMAVVIAVRTILEAQHGSRADSETGQDLLATFTQQIRRYIEVAVYRDVVRPLIALNFGEETAQQMCPYLSLSNVAPEDRVAVGNMIAGLARANYLHSSQYQGIDAMLALPERDMEAQQAEEAEQKQIEADRRAALDLGLGLPADSQAE